jgi:hypothetical protein
MRRNNAVIAIVLLVFCLMPPLPGSIRAYGASPKVAHVVYLTTSKACGCTLKLCKAGDELVAQVFTGPRLPLLERLDYVKDKDQARSYIQEYHLYSLPVLLFLDDRHNLLWSRAGELKKAEIIGKLEQFGG